MFRNPSGNVESVLQRRGAVPALLVVATAVGIEVLALSAVVGVYAVELVRSHAQDLLGAVVTALLAAAAAAGLAACARALLRGRRWARGPVLTWQLLQGLVSATFIPGPLRWEATAGVLVAVVAVGGLFTPAALRATRGGEPPPLI